MSALYEHTLRATAEVVQQANVDVLRQMFLDGLCAVQDTTKGKDALGSIMVELRVELWVDE